MSSTSEAKTRKPAEIAFMIPTTRRPTSESGEYKVCVAMPIAMPPGVLGIVLAGRNKCGWREDLRATIRESHKPRLCSAWLPFDVGDTYTEGKAFEGFYQSQYTCAVGLEG